MTIAALFIDEFGPYPGLVGSWHCWPAYRDARTYAGPHPVVAHPPCNLWVNLAASNYARATARCGHLCEAPSFCPSCQYTGRREPNRRVVKPAWYPGGDDDGCFASALDSVRRWGGVLEHPAFTHAWEAHDVPHPTVEGWIRLAGQGEWICEVWQTAYGHRALSGKRTWLLYCGVRPPFDLNWAREKGTHAIGGGVNTGFCQGKPKMSKREASATPSAFAETLIRLAHHAQS